MVGLYALYAVVEYKGKSMTIKEIKEKRATLESNIRDMLLSFEADTGVIVNNVCMNIIDTSTVDRIDTLYTVNIDVSL